MNGHRRRLRNRFPGAVQVSAETLARTTLGAWTVGSPVNLERSLKVGDELGGHLVSGHVDGVATVVSRTPEAGSTRFAFELPAGFERLVAPKGSIALAMTCRLLRLAPSELARALARPAACAVLVGVAVFATLPADDALGNVGALLLVAAVASVSFLIGLVLFARPLVSPIVAGLRRA